MRRGRRDLATPFSGNPRRGWNSLVRRYGGFRIALAPDGDNWLTERRKSGESGYGYRRYRQLIDVQRVDYIRIPVTDMQKANHFYGEVLGLERNRARRPRTGSSTRPAT